MDQTASNVRRSDRVTRHRSFEVETIVTHNIILIIIISVERKKQRRKEKTQQQQLCTK